MIQYNKDDQIIISENMRMYGDDFLKILGLAILQANQSQVNKLVKGFAPQFNMYYTIGTTPILKYLLKDKNYIPRCEGLNCFKDNPISKYSLSRQRYSCTCGWTFKTSVEFGKISKRIHSKD